MACRSQKVKWVESLEERSPSASGSSVYYAGGPIWSGSKNLFPSTALKDNATGESDDNLNQRTSPLIIT